MTNAVNQVLRMKEGTGESSYATSSYIQVNNPTHHLFLPDFTHLITTK